MTFRNWTPNHLRCWPAQCPAVFEKDNGDILVIGKSDMLAAIATGNGIGSDEFAVTLPREYFTDLARKLMDEENQRNPTGLNGDKGVEDLPW